MRTHCFDARVLIFTMALVGILATNASVRAGVIHYSSQSRFESQGTILSSSDLAGFGTGVSVFGPETQLGDIILNTVPYGVVLGTANTFYPTLKNVLVQPNFGSVIFNVVTSPPHLTWLDSNLAQCKEVVVSSFMSSQIWAARISMSEPQALVALWSSQA